jgi:hypothetical protein
VKEPLSGCSDKDGSDEVIPPSTGKNEPKGQTPPVDTNAQNEVQKGIFAHGGQVQDTTAATEIEVPEAPVLPDALEIARALRPLARRYQTAMDGPLDEEATVEQTAHLRRNRLRICFP